MELIEIWKSVLNYEGIYEISNLGNIKSLDRKIPDGRKENSFRIKKGNTIKASKLKYSQVILCKNKIRKAHLLHRIVATAFLENKENKPCVNHKDLNKQNNKVDNLEWCTYSENNIHAIKNGAKKPYWIDKKRSQETKDKISLSKKGKLSNRKNYIVSQETKDKISNTLKNKHIKT